MKGGMSENQQAFWTFLHDAKSVWKVWVHISNSLYTVHMHFCIGYSTLRENLVYRSIANVVFEVAINMWTYQKIPMNNMWLPIPTQQSRRKFYKKKITIFVYRQNYVWFDYCWYCCKGYIVLWTNSWMGRWWWGNC